MAEVIEFETERLHLRQWIAADREPFAALPFSPCVEIGWRLASEHWGRGFASEAASGALRAGFELLDLPEIASFTALHNLRSRALMERLGMREAKDTFEHPGVAPGHALRQHCLYRLSQECHKRIGGCLPQNPSLRFNLMSHHQEQP